MFQETGYVIVNAQGAFFGLTVPAANKCELFPGFTHDAKHATVFPDQSSADLTVVQSALEQGRWARAERTTTITLI